MPKIPSPEEFRKYPDMVHWFNPVLLYKLLLQVIIADVFGQYADSRLVHAALDNVGKDEHWKRADITAQLAADEEGAVWIDYVSDLGDGFDATYAIAYLLAQDQLKIDGRVLPRGSALFMGGDEVYPTATRDNYMERLRRPYAFAFPKRRPGSPVPIFLIPGNHDWYDGLVNFVAIFCREWPTAIGGWRTRQRRSYFAAKITETCWVWGIDIALTDEMDQPQADYFVAIAESMPHKADIILCTAVPGWYDPDLKAGSYRTLSYAAEIAENAGKSLRVPLVLSGDTHHYCRYSGGGTQFITSGGGGAFLHGTHSLKDTITADWLHQSETELSLKTSPASPHSAVKKPACYPSREASRALPKRNVLFPLSNWDFSLALGGVYWLLAFWIIMAPRGDVAFIICLFLAAVFCGYTSYQEEIRSDIALITKKRAAAVRVAKVVLFSLLHALVHFGAIALLAYFFFELGSAWFDLRNWPWWGLLLTLLGPMVLVGGIVAGLIFGLNLYLMCCFANMSHNDAFSAMRLNSYRHFLRIRIAGNLITVFPIGLDKVPRRRDWQLPPDGGPRAPGPVIVPKEPLEYRLVEEPVEVARAAAASTEQVRTPDEIEPAGGNDAAGSGNSANDSENPR